MKLAYLSPLPPAKSGIANYSAMLLPALSELAEVTAVTHVAELFKLGRAAVISFEEYAGRRGDFDAAIYQLGNNPYHEWIYREAWDHPGVTVLHEVVLHHLLVEMTLARGQVEEYVQAMCENHGAAGEAWARARAIGLHTELSNFLMPASTAVANRSRSVIVHNRYAGQRLRDCGVTVPISVIGHPLIVPDVPPASGREIRAALGYRDDDRVIGMFGFVTASKRPEVIFEAFGAARARDSRLRLLVVGEPAPNVDLGALASRFELPAGSWTSIGYAGDEDFDRYIAAVDLVVNLRHPTGGETSGALLRVLAAGKTVAVNGYAQFAEYPDEVVTKIPFGSDEVARLAEFMTDARAGSPEMQRTWIREHADVRDAARKYLAAISLVGSPVDVATKIAPIPLFPDLAAELRLSGRVAIVTLTNRGSETLHAATVGLPGYRVVFKATTARGPVWDRWVALPGDLRPGESIELRVEIPVGDAEHLELVHALEGIPSIGEKPFARFEVPPHAV